MLALSREQLLRIQDSSLSLILLLHFRKTDQNNAKSDILVENFEKTWTEEATQIDSDESTQSEEHIVELLSDEEDNTQGVLRAMDKSRIIQSDLDRLPPGTPQEPADIGTVP